MKKKLSGFTLIELMIVLFFIGVFMSVLWVIYKTQFLTFYSQSTRSNLKADAGLAFSTMPKELRQAVSITAASGTGLTFTADTDGDGVDETIQYAWSGSAGAPLNRVSGGLTRALVNTVNSVTFSYYDSSNNLLSSPVTLSQVKLVAIDLTAASSDESFELRSQVRCRNF
jgi:prepilin-type N-terminal cleavage/methylation domain-containing protein